MDTLDIARRLFAAIQAADLESLEVLYDDDVEQVEHPNRLLPTGARRNKGQILEAARRGRALMAEQRFDITHAQTQDRFVAIEANWRGRLAVDAPALGLRSGDTMTARFAQFIEVREGRVVRHATYDCFDPWTSDNASSAATVAGAVE